MTNTEEKRAKNYRLRLARLFAFLLVITISGYIIFIPEEHARNLENFGYLGVFLLSILSNATVLIPAPGLIVVFSMGAKFNPFWIGIAAGLGAALGEISGYLAGFSGQAIIEDMSAYEKMVGWMQRNGPITVVSLAFIPNPLFDLTGIVAGALKMPLWKFLLWAAIGKVIKMWITAYAGSGILNAPWLVELFSPKP